MKLMSENKGCVLIEEEINQHQDAIKLPLYSIWLKLKPYITVVVLLLSSILAISFFNTYQDDIITLLKIEQINICWKLIIAILGFLIIISMLFLMLIVHEILHMLCYIILRNRSFVVISKSAISVMSIVWQTKFYELFSIVFPFFAFLIISFVLYMVTMNIYVLLWITIMNFALSSSDIVNFVIILLKVPKDALILGHYYRCQQ